MRTTLKALPPASLSHRVTSHFGEWLQGRLGPEGPVVLVTLACADIHVDADHAPSPDLELHHATPGAVTLPQLRDLLRCLGKPASGIFRLAGNAPPGAGAGASTAALVALARSVGADEARLPAACLAVEGASDPLMLPQPDSVLWASRQGVVLDHLPPPPCCDILGGYLGAPVPTVAADQRFADISDLVAAWREASGAGDLARLAALASEAACRTTGLRGPVPDPVPDLARTLGALGHARAHTGSARALIFAPGAVPAGAGAVLEQAGLTGVFSFRTGRNG
ncbi:hypothetical protein [Puniceibacterium confluentis]|uniref:hypothetical protein n=1 Tax=Puniceibacterium confluentis TaxID=1958944 RepID=UPI0011B560C4|nr:hypothetical protein [Puniceibacterium confluentis]